MLNKIQIEACVTNFRKDNIFNVPYHELVEDMKLVEVLEEYPRRV